MKFVERQPFADLDATARRIVEIANGKRWRMAASSSNASMSHF